MTEDNYRVETIPIVEETVRSDKRSVETGRVQSRTLVDNEQVTFTNALKRDIVDVEHVVEKHLFIVEGHHGARLRVPVYADAREPSNAGAAFSKASADSVKAALAMSGVPAERIESASGNDADPLNRNATSAGPAENRRTELVVLQR